MTAKKECQGLQMLQRDSKMASDAPAEVSMVDLKVMRLREDNKPFRDTLEYTLGKCCIPWTRCSHLQKAWGSIPNELDEFPCPALTILQ
jgi:hypothetical protein